VTQKRRAPLARRWIDGKRTGEAGTAATIARIQDLQQCLQSRQTEFCENPRREGMMSIHLMTDLDLFQSETLLGVTHKASGRYHRHE
jgi:hypothetical protein